MTCVLFELRLICGILSVCTKAKPPDTRTLPPFHGGTYRHSSCKTEGDCISARVVFELRILLRSSRDCDQHSHVVWSPAPGLHVPAPNRSTTSAEESACHGCN